MTIPLSRGTVECPYCGQPVQLGPNQDPREYIHCPSCEVTYQPEDD